MAVKACDSAYIILAESPGVNMYNAYEIELGILDNTVSVIYKHAEVAFSIEVMVIIFMYVVKVKLFGWLILVDQ